VEVLRNRVLLRPRDLEVSLAFYEGALGLHRSREFGSAPHRGIVLFLGGTELELSEGGGPDPDTPLPTGVRLWLQVPDVDAVVAQLSIADVVVPELPERKEWGLIEAVVHDPDGLPLILVEVPADHPLRRDHREPSD
jgi:catechol 2,3-dioxygenase-like lactoylglutathione lyase family enzyme